MCIIFYDVPIWVMLYNDAFAEYELKAPPPALASETEIYVIRITQTNNANTIPYSLMQAGSKN